MDKDIKADLFRYDQLTGIKGFIQGWFDSGFRYTYFLRKTIKYNSHSLRGICFRIFKRLFTYRGYHIDTGADIGKGFSLYHKGTVYIGPIKIGKYCTVGHNVTIGRSLKGGTVGRPTIGDRVWIGTGAVVVGKINIGSNVMIAPNSFVNFDVPDNSIVIGNPGKIIQKENPTKNYITNILDENE